eukprot:3100383-Amphidinium_carterae.1
MGILIAVLGTFAQQTDLISGNKSPERWVREIFEPHVVPPPDAETNQISQLVRERADRKLHVVPTEYPPPKPLQLLTCACASLLKGTGSSMGTGAGHSCEPLTK